MSPINGVIDRWHAALRGEVDGGFAELLHEDCVFWSPVLHKPQKGRELSAMYLEAAFKALPGTTDDGDDSSSTDGTVSGSFRYTKRVLDGNVAVLEFETRLGSIEVNGVDIITCNDDGQIVEFKVMVRPHKALEAVRQAMVEALGI